jgi:hypothetical protein
MCSSGRAGNPAGRSVNEIAGLVPVFAVEKLLIFQQLTKSAQSIA